MNKINFVDADSRKFPREPKKEKKVSLASKE